MDNTESVSLSVQDVSCSLQHEVIVPSPFEEVSIDHSYHSWVSPSFTSVVEGTVCYISGFVVKKALQHLTCNTCRESLVSSNIPKRSDNMYHLLVLKNRGGLVIPSLGTVTILLATERAIRRLMNIHSVKNICSKQQVLYQLKAEYGACDPFSLGEHIIDTQDGIDNHYFSIIELLVAIYYNLRQHHIAKVYTQRNHALPVRQKLTKTILFKGN